MLVNWPGPPPALPSPAEGEDGPARLYLVEPGRGLPALSGCLEDWVVLPATDEEISARAAALLMRLRSHRDGPRGPLPRLDPVGVLHHGDRWVDLSPLEARLMSELLACFGEPVATEDLVGAVWGSGKPRAGNLRVHILRLRRRIQPLGLRIHSLPGRGYLLSWSSPPETE